MKIQGTYSEEHSDLRLSGVVMTAITFFGGAGETGGNKKVIEDRNSRFVLDFGKSCAAEGSSSAFLSLGLETPRISHL